MQTMELPECSRLSLSYQCVMELLWLCSSSQDSQAEKQPLWYQQLLLNLAYCIAPCSLAVGADTRSLSWKCLEMKCHQQG